MYQWGCGKRSGGGIVKRVFHKCLQRTFKDTFWKYLDKVMIPA